MPESEIVRRELDLGFEYSTRKDAGARESCIGGYLEYSGAA